MTREEAWDVPSKAREPGGDSGGGRWGQFLVCPVLLQKTNPTGNWEADWWPCHIVCGAGSLTGNPPWSQQSSMVVTAPPPNFCFCSVTRASCLLLPCPGCARGSLRLHQLHRSPFFVSEKKSFLVMKYLVSLFTVNRLLERPRWGHTRDREGTGTQEVLEECTGKSEAR